jgi:hypothetical protein
MDNRYLPASRHSALSGHAAWRAEEEAGSAKVDADAAEATSRERPRTKSCAPRTLLDRVRAPSPDFFERLIV